MNRNQFFLAITVLIIAFYASWENNRQETYTKDRMTVFIAEIDSLQKVVASIDSSSRAQDSLQWNYFNYTSFNLHGKFICLGQEVDFDREIIRERVEYEIYRFLRFRGRIHEWLKRMGRYGPLIDPIMAEHNLTYDFRWLAVIEGLLDPNSVSPTGPKGMWQFTRKTGQAYGLGQNYYRDQRKDPWRSTKAARNHLVDLYGVGWLQGDGGPGFHDMWLTLAAYNAGPGVINTATRVEKTRDFWALKSIRNETRRYVPQFIALCYIMSHLEEFGFDEIDPYRPIPNFRDTVVTLTGPNNSLGDLAAAAGVDFDNFILLNTDYEVVTLPAGSYQVKTTLPDSTNLK